MAEATMKQALILITLLALLAHKAWSDDIGKSYIDGNMAYHKGDYAGAIKHYNKAIEQSSEDAKLYFFRGRAYSAKSDYGKAVRDFNKAIELDPKKANLYFERGSVYFNQKDYKKAEKDFNEYLKLKPNAAGQADLKEILKDMELDVAIQDLSKAIQLSPNHAELYVRRGNARFEKAIEDSPMFKKMLAESNPDKTVQPSLNNNLLLQKKGDFDAAIKENQQAYELEAVSLLGYAVRKIKYLKEEGLKETMADYNKAIQLKPELADAYYQRGHAYLLICERKKAVKDFNRFIELKPNDPAGYFCRGYARSYTNDYDDSIKDLTKVIKLRPSSTGAYYQRAQSKKKKGDIQGALGDLKKVTQIDSQYWGAYLERGIINIEREEYQAAINDFTKCLDIKPDLAYGYYFRGMTKFKKGDDAGALKDLVKSKQLQPDSYLASLNDMAIEVIKRKDPNYVPKIEEPWKNIKSFTELNTKLKESEAVLFLKSDEIESIFELLIANPKYIDELIKAYPIDYKEGITQDGKADRATRKVARYKQSVLYLLAGLTRRGKIPESRKDALIKFFRKCMHDPARTVYSDGKLREPLKSRAAGGLKNLADSSMKEDFAQMVKDSDKWVCVNGTLGLLKLQEDDLLFELLVAKDKTTDWDIKTTLEFLKRHDKANKTNKFTAFNERISKYLDAKKRK